MQNEFQSEETSTPQILSAATEADAQAASLISERLNEITAHANRVQRRLLISSTVTFVCLGVASPLISILLKGGSLLHHPALFLFSLIGLAAFAPTVWLGRQGIPKFDAMEMAQIGGTRAIMPLFATFRASASAKKRQAIQSALTQLLPHMKANEANLLTPDAYRTLYFWLNATSDKGATYSYPEDLRIAVLKALGQVGGSDSIPHVERLANSSPRTPGQARVRQAAIDCLPMLRANCRGVETSRTLLRASQAGEARPDTLLRPASNSGQTNSAELLRGADSPDAPPSEGTA